MTPLPRRRITRRKESVEKPVTKLYKKQFDIAQIADIMEISVKNVKDILKSKGLVSLTYIFS